MNRRVLIIKPSSLGDVANALAVVPCLRAGLPGAVLHWLVNTDYAGLVAAAGVDEARVFARNDWRSFSSEALSNEALRKRPAW